MKVSIVHIVLTMFTEKNHWELRRVVLDDEKKTQIDVYVCIKNGIWQWVESTKGLAYSKFGNIIPNEIVNAEDNQNEKI